MPLKRLVHQIFFDFDGRRLEDFPTFVTSRDMYANMKGWSYTLWDESMVAIVLKDKYPHMLDEYNALPHAIQKVDLAKYITADAVGAVVSDLDVVPATHVDNIVPTPCAFDWCSRARLKPSLSSIDSSFGAVPLAREGSTRLLRP